MRSTEGFTPLHLAARAQSTSVASLLLASGADSSIVDASGRTALHYAAQTGNWSLFHSLHEHAACSVLQPDNRGEPVHFVVTPPLMSQIPSSESNISRQAQEGSISGEQEQLGNLSGCAQDSHLSTMLWKEAR